MCDCGTCFVEFTVGSDTRGSVRKPAAFAGAYGIRPTHGSLTTHSVPSLAEDMDTAGYFARDPRLFVVLGIRWQGLLTNPSHPPKRSSTQRNTYTSQTRSSRPFRQLRRRPLEAPQNNHCRGQLTASLLDHNTLVEYHSWVSVGKPLVEAYKYKFNVTPTFDPRAL
ncbi:hypothetical protein C0992_000970 [Termitomyces sp. T32_za158]|nr:hypothetical protein C0992_000970 [Termitomyces sp. T32_za158]